MNQGSSTNKCSEILHNRDTRSLESAVWLWISLWGQSKCVLWWDVRIKQKESKQTLQWCEAELLSDRVYKIHKCAQAKILGLGTPPLAPALPWTPPLQVDPAGQPCPGPDTASTRLSCLTSTVLTSSSETQTTLKTTCLPEFEAPKPGLSFLTFFIHLMNIHMVHGTIY